MKLELMDLQVVKEKLDPPEEMAKMVLQVQLGLLERMQFLITVTLSQKKEIRVYAVYLELQDQRENVV